MTERSLWQRCRRTPALIFWGTVTFLILSFAAIFAVDILGLFAVRERIFGDAMVPYMWFHWFHTPVERPIQFLLLAAAVFLCFRTFARWPDQRSDPLRTMWLWWGIGLLLMYLEETVDLRHLLRDTVTAAAGRERFGVVGTILELGVFVVIGLTMLYVLSKFRRRLWSCVKARGYLIVAYGCYAVAVGLSWLGRAFDSLEGHDAAYRVAGKWVLDLLLLTDESQTHRYEQVNQLLASRGEYPLEYWVMDRVVEESFELLGAAAMLTAVIYVLLETDRGDDDADD